MMELRRHIMSTKTDIEDDSLFYIESLENNNEILLDNSTWIGTNSGDFFYSLNKTSWSPLPANIVLNKNKKAYFISSGKNLQKSSNNTKPLFNSTLKVNIGGDIKELLFPYDSCISYGLNNLFTNIPIVDASKIILPIATNGSIYYFQNMFGNCVFLENAPEIPKECGSAQYMYQGMFAGCESLIKAPSYLGSRALYQSHEYMFYNCKSLKESPIMTISFSTYSFRYMFKNCESLSKITCINSGNAQPFNYKDWVAGVAVNGLFLKRKGVEWSVGTDGIPEGWEVRDYEE